MTAAVPFAPVVELDRYRRYAQLRDRLRLEVNPSAAVTAVPGGATVVRGSRLTLRVLQRKLELRGFATHLSTSGRALAIADPAAPVEELLANPLGGDAA